MAVKRNAERSIHTYYRYHSMSDLGSRPRFRGPLRVIVFCVVTILLPSLLLVAPLYIRYYHFRSETYHLGESDLVTVDKPISTLWCEGQDLWMNATFHAYLLDKEPAISEDLQHFEMDKHVQLADDSLEYWGFFLLQGSKVILSVCSRYDGARLMVVKGTKNLKHCALLDPPSKTDTVDPWEDNVSAKEGEIKVEFHSGEKPEKEEMSMMNHKKEFGLKKPRQNQVIVQTVVLPTSQNSTLEVKSMDEMGANVNTSSSSNSTLMRKKFRKKKNQTETTMDGVDRVVRETKGNSEDEEYEYVDTVGAHAENDLLRSEDLELEDEDESEHTGGGEQDDDEDEAPNPVGVEPEHVENSSKKAKQDEEIDEEDIRSSGSSFAKNLWTCYGGDTLFTQSFTPSPRCSSQDSMMKYAVRMRTVHEITSTGYYYYIFYSDNDVVSNTIYAKFEINKVLYQLPNFTQSCLNSTHCSLPLNFMSAEKVLLEVPLQDGVSDEDALAQMILISSCRPRLGVYFIFPVAILFLIVCCAFM